MTPMSLYTLDANTLRQIAQRDDRACTSGERCERGFGLMALAATLVALLVFFLR